MAHINFSESRRLLVLVMVGILGHASQALSQGAPGAPGAPSEPEVSGNLGNKGKSEEPSGILFAPEEDDEEVQKASSSPKPNPPAAAPQGAAAQGAAVQKSGPQGAAGPAPSAGPSTLSQKMIGERLRPKNSPSGILFGQYRVRVGGAQPSFSDELKYYDAFYGAASYYPTISADWYAFDWYATFGLSIRSGFYTDEGKAVRGIQEGQSVSKDQVTSDNIQPDIQASTTLTLVPLQLCAIVQFTPFNKKWLVLDGWFGLERLYFQEVRASTRAAMIQTTSNEKDTALTNNGFKGGVLYGFGANIRIDSLDEESALSMKNMGLSAVYINPYMEQVQQTDKWANFSRRVLGLAFVFESTL